MDALARVEALVAELRDPWLVSRVLVRREAISSSAIEGTNSTLDELLAVEETEGGQDGSDEAARQVRDYALCLDTLIPEARTRGPEVFTVDLVRDLHRAVMRNDPDYRDIPGEFRTAVVWIGGRGDIAYSTFNPPPPDRVPSCLQDSVEYLRDAHLHGMAASFVSRMAVGHAHFEAVHPFRDGNGRVGRLLLPLAMAADGRVPLYLSPYIEANRAAYYAALRAAQQRLQWHEMVGFVADAVTGTVAELRATRAALSRLLRTWEGRRRFRAGSASSRALSFLPHYPVVTIRRLADLLDVSWPQASQAAAQLVQAGILQERTGYRRNRLFAAGEALSIINRPFGEEPVLPG